MASASNRRHFHQRRHRRGRTVRIGRVRLSDVRQEEEVAKVVDRWKVAGRRHRRRRFVGPSNSTADQRRPLDGRISATSPRDR